MSFTKDLAELRNFRAESLSPQQVEGLAERARQARCDAVLMTGIAASGHPAGALSSMDIYNLLFAVADLTPENCNDVKHDRVVVSHGHTSAGVYAALARWGFVDRDEAAANFRRAGSPFQGHVERDVPGVDWGTGNLGQGLSAAVGFALADRTCGRDSRVFVVLGDGEQPKGQLAEARRVAAKERLSAITCLIDANDIQICGQTSDIMPADIRALWAADGWQVVDCDGHDYGALYGALRKAVAAERPVVIICKTVMGKGVSFMENIPDYHGKAASGDLLAEAVRQLGGAPADIERLKELRKGKLPTGRKVTAETPLIQKGAPAVYVDLDKKDARGAFGAALADVAALNNESPESTPILAFDCDLAGSVKLDSFAKHFPEHFIQLGIQEHNAATICGAASTAGVVPVWADFGVFGADEVYNQQRLNDINRASSKTVLTHVGLDVGEDGPTHQCIDYVGLFNNMFGWKLVVPADANQTDRATRWMLSEPGNVCLAVGRSVKPIVKTGEGKPFFDADYSYVYGRIDLIRDGGDGVILALGQMAAEAVSAADLLAEKGISARVLVSSSPLATDIGELSLLIDDMPLVTCEDHNVRTGLGAIVAALIAQAGMKVKMKNLGVTRYGESGAAAEVMADMGLTAGDIAAAVESLL